MRKNFEKRDEMIKKQLSLISPTEREIKILTLEISNFVFRLNSELRKIDAFAIIGGSFAKGTIIKGKRYDLDLFARFDYNKYVSREKQQISELLFKILRKINKLDIETLHGSRDYFRVYLKKAEKLIGIPVYVEIVPVLAVKKAEESVNVTDVSPLHILYVLDKIKKNPELADSIKLAKSLCYGQGCYGAESHIKGFSGYCLELLCIHFGSFIELLKAASEWNLKKKIIIDMPKFYKNKDMLMIEMNEAKTLPPLILVDPVQPDRNAAAAVSPEKLEIFIKAARAFIKNPSLRLFIKKEANEKEMQSAAKSKRMSLISIVAESGKGKEDIAGAKLFKLFNMLLERFKKEGRADGKWVYNEEERKAKFFFLFKPEKKIIVKGPPVNLEKNVKMFRKKWPRSFVKAGNVYARRKSKGVKEIISLPKEQMAGMGISKIKLV